MIWNKVSEIEKIVMTCYTIFILVLIAVVSVNSLPQLYFDGRNASAGAQCRSRGNFGGACKTLNLARRCLNMICAKCTHRKCSEGVRHEIPLPYDVGPALQGTSCGENKICIAGQCIDDPEPPEVPIVLRDFVFVCEGSS